MHLSWKHPAALVVAIFMVGGPCRAQLSPALDRFHIAVGGFSGTTDTTFRADLQQPDGSIEHRHANLESDGHMRRQQMVLRVQADGVVGNHLGWAVDYYQLNQHRGGLPTFHVPISGRNVLVDGSSSVRAQFDMGTISDRYWIGEQRDVLGVGLGLSYYHIHLKIEGDETVSYTHGKMAPSVSLAYIHAFDHGWKAYAKAQGIVKSSGPEQGRIYQAAVGVRYTVDGHWGAGVEYGLAHLGLLGIKGTYTGMINLNVHGPGAYLSYAW